MIAEIASIPNTESVSDAELEKALARKKSKEILFLYFALLHGWKIQMISQNKFIFTRPIQPVNLIV